MLEIHYYDAVMVLGHGCARWALQWVALVACALAGALAPERVEPCAGSPLCSCRVAHMSCIAVPLHRFPGTTSLDTYCALRRHRQERPSGCTIHHCLSCTITISHNIFIKDLIRLKQFSQTSKLLYECTNFHIFFQIRSF